MKTKSLSIDSQAKLSAFSASADDEGVASYEEMDLYTQPPEKVVQYLKKMDWGFVNDKTGFLGHDLHPYPAKFIPQLPGSFISLLSSRGELVFDPFGGSGTTALEAVRLGRRAVSVDANPIAALIGKVKTANASKKTIHELHTLHGALKDFLASPPATEKELIDSYQRFAPAIANREKWFSDASFGELSHIKYRISKIETEAGKNIALLALSRSVLACSFQDSETRYKSVPRKVALGETTKKYISEFEAVMRSVSQNAAATRYGISKFITDDIRNIAEQEIAENSVDLIVTSPPYGNATDYHLYHRFRLLWLGYDPIKLGKVEIGSHLKHQRESSGFESYYADMKQALKQICRTLKPGRYATLIIGDSIYKGKNYNTAEIIAAQSEDYGFDFSAIFERPLHKTKRSFGAGRRATTEKILILRKRREKVKVTLGPAPYKLWEYEEKLRVQEINKKDGKKSSSFTRSANAADLVRYRSLTFTHNLKFGEKREELTWQAILENGMANNPSSRKQPKYVTHGIHNYKGKFYPQLAKSLINLSGIPHGSKILDPFCGSGTTLLEGHLNGYYTFGCDLNPLAAQIARAKACVLDVDPDVFSEVISSVIESIETAPPLKISSHYDQFKTESLDEINRWFAPKVIAKANFLLETIRVSSSGIIREFLEVIFSSIVRDISQQETNDLRIRYRKDRINDADVFGLFIDRLTTQFDNIRKFWKIKGYSPNPFFFSAAIAADNRTSDAYQMLGLQENSVDLVLTSPPYAMALPYIDTDRLSLLMLFGLYSSNRRPIESNLIGSREISTGEKRRLESEFTQAQLPSQCKSFISHINSMIEKSENSGFRKRNMPALIYRFLKDMDQVFCHLYRVCKKGSEVMMVIGDSRMTIDGQEIKIPTTELTEIIAKNIGFTALKRINISVTKENMLHMKNTITENAVLRLKKPV